MGNRGKRMGKVGNGRLRSTTRLDTYWVFVRMRRKQKKRLYFRTRQNFEKIRKENTFKPVQARRVHTRLISRNSRYGSPARLCRAHFSKLKNQSNYWRAMYVGMVCLYGYLSLVNYCDMHVEREREARERFTRERSNQQQSIICLF